MYEYTYFTIDATQALTDLDVSYNKLQKLPSSLGKLTRLSTFKASFNQISGLGPEVRLLPML
jgi:Leucine-rich repeat (LRR) protein